MTGCAAVVAAAVMAVATVATVAGPRAAPHFVWNVSASAPTGFYRVRPVAHPTVTTLVVANLPEPLATWLDEGRYLPRGVPLLKPVLALSGQRVCRISLAITVDGHDTGVARERDRSGRLLPVWQGCRAIGERAKFS
jgi:type IV secretory pathway protease TraF